MATKVKGDKIKEGSIPLSALSSEIQNKLNEITIVSVTYAELVILRNNGELVSGQQYRITDYETTTTQENTQSAGHAFDVVVMALDESTLSENASAIRSARDTENYFGTENPEAWQLKYCLDNDTDRFAWADATNGKGVIYRMIDEYGNECPYDFKNIQFKHPYNTVTYPAFYYTFSTVISGVVGDHSFNGADCYGNKIGLYVNNGKQNLNSIVFINESTTAYCHSNSFGNNCHSNSFGNACRINSFGNSCYNNSFGNSCYNNSFGNSCYNNSFGNNCYSNSFGNGCRNNSFAFDAETIGNYFSYNTFGEGVRSVKLLNEEIESSSNVVQNYKVANGTNNVKVAVTRNNTEENYIGKNSDGKLKVFCLADLAN